MLFLLASRIVARTSHSCFGKKVSHVVWHIFVLCGNLLGDQGDELEFNTESESLGRSVVTLTSSGDDSAISRLVASGWVEAYSTPWVDAL